MIPLRGDDFQGAPRLLDLSGFKLPQPLPANLRIARKSGAGQYGQMFGDGLPGQVRVSRELGDRHGAPKAESRDESQSGLIAQSRKDWRAILQCCGFR
jgi:hypothetical protein